jgi:hypothetical protein
MKSFSNVIYDYFDGRYEFFVKLEHRQESLKIVLKNMKTLLELKQTIEDITFMFYRLDISIIQ